MRPGRPLPLLLAAASMAVAGMGVSLGATPSVDEDKPRHHEHKREIARRLRQAERDRHNREARGIPGVMGFSRSRLTCYAYAEGKVFRGRRQVEA